MTNWIDPEDRLLDSLLTMFENEAYWCENCIQFHKDRITCGAFPGDNGYGIHSDILTGQIKHTKSMFGQKNTIVFESKTGKKPKKRRIRCDLQEYNSPLYRVKSFVFLSDHPHFMEFVTDEDGLYNYIECFVGIRDIIISIERVE